MTDVWNSLAASALIACAAYAAGVALFGSGATAERAHTLEGQELAPAPHMLRPTQPERSFKELISAFLVKTLNLRRWFALDDMRERLVRAGKRGQNAETTYLAAKFVSPIVCVLGAIIYFFVLEVLDLPLVVKMCLVIFAAYIGVKIPDTLIDRAIRTRQESIQDAWSDALDLLIIQIEGGQSVDTALRRVASEISVRSKPLAEDLTILLTEMSVLREKRHAFENFGRRSDVVEVKSACMALIQSDEQGTELSTAFRALAADGRSIRLSRIEKRAAAVAAILPLPVAVFFLLPLMVLAVMPAAIEFLKWN